MHLFHFENNPVFTAVDFQIYAQQNQIYFSNDDSFLKTIYKEINNTLRISLRKKFAQVLGSNLKPYLKDEGLKNLVNKFFQTQAAFAWENFSSFLNQLIDDSKKKGRQKDTNQKKARTKKTNKTLTVPDQILLVDQDSQIPFWQNLTSKRLFNNTIKKIGRNSLSIGKASNKNILTI